jgi:hypothetical protein
MKPIQKSISNTKPNKRTRGYRLKPSTHVMILKIQKILHSDQDKVIAGACSMFLTELKKNNQAKSLK